MIRVVLGEDNVLVREGVRALLNSYEDIEVVGVAEDAPTLLATAAEHAPDVVVTDIKMPPSFQLEGIDCAHSIRERHPDTGVVVLSAHDDEEYAIALLGKGHSGLAYLLKDRIAQGDELARAIREVRQAGAWSIRRSRNVSPVARSPPAEDRIVLDMMAQGLGYEEMAAHLGTTQEAVDGRVTALFRRMAGRRRSRHRSARGVQEAARGGRGAVGDRRRRSSPTCRRSSSTRWRAAATPRASASSRSRSCSATSGASPRSRSASRPVTSRRSSAGTSARWPR